MKKHTILLSFILSAFLLLNFMEDRKPVLYLIGDSTMADKPLDDNPERGWGQLLPGFMTDEVLIENHAKNGRSTKSFIDQGLWQEVYDKLHPGDYVFIQFGHNDSKTEDTSRYAEPHSAYKDNLIKFVMDTRSKGAFPVLLTPVSRRKFDKTGKLVDSHGDYPVVVREIAQTLQVPLIDMHQKTLKLLAELGPEKSKELFEWVAPNAYKSLPNGKEDNTHFNRTGAIKMAELAVEGIKELNLPLVKMLKSFDETSSMGNGKLV
ncbi:MAG: rhamnogalacturonan acetylesterase, partial [Syntrophothermus sp.]